MRTRSLIFTSLATAVVLACRSSDPDPSPTVEPQDDPSWSVQDDSTWDDSTWDEPQAVESDFAEPIEEVDTTEAAFAASVEPSPQGLDETTERLDRVRQRREYLAGELIQQGDQHLERGDLENALQAFADALDVMPSNEEARSGLRRVESLMGDRFAQAGEYIEDAVQRESVRRAQARIAAQQHVTDGDNFLRTAEYDQAIESYRRAETILRYHPLIAEGSLDEGLVTEKLQSAARLAEEADAAETREREDAARAERMAREEEQRDYRETKLRTLYAEANAYFNREHYGTAESLAEQILLLDPGNETATELRDIAQAARHQKTNQDIQRRYRENWIRTFEELETSAVPQQDTLVFDDLKRWRDVSQRKPYEFSRGDASATADKEAILQRLDELRIRPRFGQDGEGAPLADIADYLQQVTGVNFLVSAKVRDELDEDDTAVYLDLNERSVLKTLEIITEIKEDLAYKIEDGVVKFVTAEELTGGQVLRMYEVRDLIRPIRDFPGPEINIDPSGGPPEFDEDLEEREALVITEDSLDALIRDNVAPESWDADVANSLRISAGTMVVNQTPEVHGEIQGLLDDLREATGIMVDIEARFLKVEDNFLEDIGVDFRGLGAPGQGTNSFFNDFGDTTIQQELGQEIGQDTDLGAFLDEGADGDIRARVENLFDSFLGDEDILTGSGGLSFQWTYLNDLQLEMVLRAVSKSERVELVTAPRVLVFNTARSNLTVLNQVAYVQDFDVEIAQAASIADPQISVIEDGVILDVRPVVSADRRFVTLELRPTVAQLRRPISTFVTSLGVSGNSVTIQLPEIEISRVRTSVPMPDGGTVLLGGFKVHETQDLRSGVPLLNKIPLVSFLFERKGHYVTNRKLLILLTANIVIPQEHEPTAAQLGIDESFGTR